MHNLSLNKQTGRHEMFSRGAAWHNLGQVVTEAQTWEQAMSLAGLDWLVEKLQLRGPDGELIPAFGTFRADNGAFLGTVGDKYIPIQNKTQFDFVDALLEAENGAHYESAGALGQGERVWVMARVGQDFQIAGTDDRHETYLLFTSSHDGRSAAQVMLTSIRVVCMNTLNQALRQDGRNALKIKHTKSAAAKLEQARALISGSIQTSQSLKEKLEALAERKMQKESMQTILSRLFPSAIKDVVPAKTQNVLADILNLYESNDGDAIPQIRGSAYNLLNAVTEYTDHVRAAKETKRKAGMTEAQLRAQSAMFGTGAQLKEQALEVILQETSGAPRVELDRPSVTVPQLPQSFGGVLDDVLNETLALS